MIVPSLLQKKADMAKVPYCSAVGSLMYAMICTRPHIAYAVGVVSRYMSNPGKKHWEAMKGIMRYLNGTQKVCICFGSKGSNVEGRPDTNTNHSCEHIYNKGLNPKPTHNCV